MRRGEQGGIVVLAWRGGVGGQGAASSIRSAGGSREASSGSSRGTLTVRLIEGSFPNYRQLLPTGYPSRLTVSRDALLQAIDRAPLVADTHIHLPLHLEAGGGERRG